MSTKRKAPEGIPSISPAEGIAGVLDIDEMTVQLLGAGQEVGRSCCVIKYKGRTIVCDSGVHPACVSIQSPRGGAEELTTCGVFFGM